jgi:hypothetical protein
MNPTLSAALAIGLVTCLAAAPGPSAAAETSHAAAAPIASAATRINDVDGDGRADLVALDPDHGVRVILADGTHQDVTRAELGDPAAEDTAFGRGFVVADLNRDGYADVLVSDWTMNDYRGVVWAIWGSARGISADHVTVILKGADAMHPVGASLAYVPEPEPVLAVGTAPAGGNGGVLLYRVGPSGRLAGHRFVTIGSPGVFDSGTEAQFAGTLASSGDLLVVGASAAGPGDYRGAVWVFQLLPRLKYWVAKVSQDRAGVPGRAENGDAFGADVSALRDWVAISVPGETVRGATIKGAVQPLTVVRTGHGLRIDALPIITARTSGQSEPVAQDHRRHLQLGWVCRGVPGVLINAGPVAVPIRAKATCGGQSLALPRGTLGTVLASTARRDAPVTVVGDMVSVGWASATTTLDPASEPEGWSVRRAIFAAPAA